jgi:hypothetical protein
VVCNYTTVLSWSPGWAPKVQAMNEAFTQPFLNLEVKKRIHSTLENTCSLKEEFFVFISNSPGW